MFSKVQRQVCQKLTGLQQHARSVANITAKSQAVFDRESKYGAHNYHPLPVAICKGEGSIFPLNFPPSPLLHIYTLIKRSRIDESTMYAMFKTSFKKSVLTSHTDHDNLSVEVKSSAGICIIDITTSAEVLHFDESAIFFVNFHRAFGSVFKEILI